MSLQQYNRIINLDLPQGQSAFLWGARKTGKSTFLKAHFPDSPYFDLLKTEALLKYSAKPHLFREEILLLSKQNNIKAPIIVDEVQKAPLLLNEIHWLIENSEAYFILCGSSARKLRRGGANLLGGRAWRYHFYPLVYKEIPNFDLLKALNTGLIPSHYLSQNPRKSIRAYVQNYLKEEIQAEGLVRNIPSFVRFLDIFAFNNTELTNFSNIAQDCAVSAKTVRAYYEILIDTLLGYFIYPYKKIVKREILSSAPKFYLFDVGIASFLAKKSINSLQGQDAGCTFENYILMELIAYINLNELDLDITYWRTKHGLEVDFVIGDAEFAIEVKISSQVRKRDLKGLCAFLEEHQPKKALAVSLDSTGRLLQTKHGDIVIMPYQEFLQKLWNNEIIKTDHSAF